MYRLQKKFGERADFIGFDVDSLEARATRFQFGMRNRSHYILLDSGKNIVTQWFGPLNEEALFEQVEANLIALGF